MTSYFRRAGAEVMRVIERALDPAATAAEVQLYSKLAYGATNPFARTSDGVVHSLAGNPANIWDRPLIPHALDDEFLSTVLDPSWSLQGAWTQGTIDPQAAFAVGNARYELHTERRRSWLMMQPPADGVQYRFYKPYAAPNDVFIWIRGSFSSRLPTLPTNNDFTVALNLSADPPDSNNLVNISINDCQAAIIQAEYGRTVAGVTTQVGASVDKFAAQADAQEIQAVGIQKIGTTYHGWAFLNNGNAIYMGSQVYAAAIASIGIQVINTTTTAPGNMIMGVDFIRVVESASFLP